MADTLIEIAILIAIPAARIVVGISIATVSAGIVAAVIVGVVAAGISIAIRIPVVLGSGRSNAGDLVGALAGALVGAGRRGGRDGGLDLACVEEEEVVVVDDEDPPVAMGQEGKELKKLLLLRVVHQEPELIPRRTDSAEVIIGSDGGHGGDRRSGKCQDGDAHLSRDLHDVLKLRCTAADGGCCCGG